ncbi:MAG TPA: redoxin domain-containing protein [Vicinamibacteria bacterium]|nr:redoxin domain-containing protein [Vicinamibacteria bacterium]
MTYVSLGLSLIGLLAAVEGVTSADLQPLDLDGRPVAALPAAGGPTTVFLFARTDCPIMNRYAPELRRLHDRFEPKGMRFWLVYPDPGETPEAVRRHAAEFSYGMAPLRDPRHSLVRLAGARVTPEAAVFVGDARGPRLVYRGRIDDRHVAFGNTRPAPTSRDLENVLAALAERKAVSTRTTTAIGCAIAPLE